MIVSDTLQRHNIAIEHDITIDEAYRVSVLAGQRWLKENKAALDNLSSSQCVVTMWDEWMMHSQYAETLKEVRGIYEASGVVRQTVDEKAHSFCVRPASEQSIAQCRDFDSSVTYILEEVAAFAVMFKETRAIDVYPGTWFKEVFVESFIKLGVPDHRLNKIPQVYRDVITDTNLLKEIGLDDSQIKKLSASSMIVTSLCDKLCS